MNGKIGMRALSTLFAVLLVSVAMVPAMACEPGTPCGDAELDLQKTNLSGLEKYEVVASALNLNEVQKLSEIPRSEDLSMIVDNAKAFSFEKELEDGSIKHATAVVLPIESVIEKDGLVQTSNIGYQFVVVIVLLGLVCSGCLETDVDVDTLLQKAAEKQANVESLAYIEKLTLYIGNETETIEYDVLLKKPDKFRRIEKSGSFIRSEVTSNGDIVWIYDPEKNIVFIRNLTSSEKLPEPAIYVLLNDNISEKYMVIGQEMESHYW